MRQNGHVDMIGTSPAISELKAEVERVARSDAKVSGFSNVPAPLIATPVGTCHSQV